jgi:PAS domain S-box-containing protein
MFRFGKNKTKTPAPAPALQPTARAPGAVQPTTPTVLRAPQPVAPPAMAPPSTIPGVMNHVSISTQNQSVAASSKSSFNDVEFNFDNQSFGSAEERLNFLNKDPKLWNVNEVAKWLSAVGLEEHVPIFREQGISGADLIDLNETDFESLRIRKLGDKKKLTRNITTLKTKRPFDARSDARSKSSSSVHSEDDDDDELDSDEETGRVTVKATRKDVPGESCVFEIDNPDLAAIKKRIKQEFGQEMVIKYKDKDGEMVTLFDDHELRRGIRNNVLTLLLTATGWISDQESKLLHNLVDSVIIIDKRGYMLYVNKACETTFGYPAKAMLGKNVKMLMTRADAKFHNNYIRTYLKSGINQVIGKGRNVTCKVSDGTTFTARLTVSESIDDLGGDKVRHHFTGTIQRLDSNASQVNQQTVTSSFQVLDAIMDSSIVINEMGTVLFFNKAAEKYWGYSKAEMMGQNVRSLMPEPFRSEHDVYLSNYTRSRIPKVIGTGRDVPIQHKDGTIIPSHLKLTEFDMMNKSYFTGVVSRSEQKVTKSALEIEREVINTLLIPAIVIDTRGTIQAFNGPATKLFELSLTEVIGRNINMLMGGTDKSRHDDYLKNYMETGKSKIIGNGRKVTAYKKSGEAVICKLWVTEKHDGNKRFFSGLLQVDNI